MGSICIRNSSLNNYEQSYISEDSLQNGISLSTNVIHSDEIHDRTSSTDDDFEDRKWHDDIIYS